MTGGTLFLHAGLGALGALATNIILPAFPRIGAEIAISSAELGLLLSSFFVASVLSRAGTEYKAMVTGSLAGS